MSGPAVTGGTGGTVSPRRPKARTDAEPPITDPAQRKRLGRSFAEDQSAAEAELYDRLRPRYPEAAVRDLLAAAGPSGAPKAVDLGAGTGILTRQMLAAGADVVAVEPSEPMLEILLRTSAELVGERGVGADRPRVEGVQAVAEQTGLPDNSADVVTVAQAWHWFDHQKVLPEIARILKPSGVLAIINNNIDTTEEWVHRLTRIMRSGDVRRPGEEPKLDPGLFGQVETTEYPLVQTLSAEDLHGLTATRSSWLAANEKERARRRGNLEWYLHEHLGYAEDAVIELPYITALHLSTVKETQ
ncbi:methyltransferase domain-containing protein [Nesterenkonia sp. MY13]|uniref:Methyltransferase domain-containing protein n=1 Tax=Nesterenkonia sedimenti TaxID=1463632 RepID=A0A7X8TM27_9MICC|nr:methyltransferase domain-containing protein [Nesterenkonia sedimenti]NLS11089.1 methyltransferase domain-containing protein [Nesterenkonia sedimenti]